MSRFMASYVPFPRGFMEMMEMMEIDSLEFIPSGFAFGSCSQELSICSSKEVQVKKAIISLEKKNTTDPSEELESQQKQPFIKRGNALVSSATLKAPEDKVKTTSQVRLGQNSHSILEQGSLGSLDGASLYRWINGPEHTVKSRKSCLRQRNRSLQWRSQSPLLNC